MRTMRLQFVTRTRLPQVPVVYTDGLVYKKALVDTLVLSTKCNTNPEAEAFVGSLSGSSYPVINQTAPSFNAKKHSPTRHYNIFMYEEIYILLFI